jgi:hypothetical protein
MLILFYLLARQSLIRQVAVAKPSIDAIQTKSKLLSNQTVF